MDVDYYRPSTNETPCSGRSLYSNESTQVFSYNQVKPNTKDKKAIPKTNNESRPEYMVCEVDIGITRSKYKSECNDVSLDSNDESWENNGRS